MTKQTRDKIREATKIARNVYLPRIERYGAASQTFAIFLILKNEEENERFDHAVKFWRDYAAKLNIEINRSGHGPARYPRKVRPDIAFPEIERHPFEDRLEKSLKKFHTPAQKRKREMEYSLERLERELARAKKEVEIEEEDRKLEKGRR